MKHPWRFAFWSLPTLAAFAWGGEDPNSSAHAREFVDPMVTLVDERVVQESVVEETPATEIIEHEVIAAEPPRRIFQNPPSRVVQGPFVRRIIPSRYAKPFNKGPYRYEPRLGDIRNLPRQLTLPGSEGERETLYSLPPRDRGYWVLPRW